MSASGDWSGYERLVLSKLDDLGRGIHDLEGKLERRVGELDTKLSDLRNQGNQEIAALKVEIAMLKVKSGLWGAAAGFLPAAMILAYELLNQ